VGCRYLRPPYSSPSPILSAPTLATASLELKAEKQSAHSKSVHSVAFSPDGLSIVSGSEDKTIKVWGERPFLDSDWEEVDTSGMPKIEGDYGDVDVLIEGLGYMENYWRNTVTGDIKLEKPASGGAPIVVGTIKVWDAGTLARQIPHPAQN
jgi:WD40 repeat protein